MKLPKIHDFNERLNFSEGVSEASLKRIFNHFLKNVPKAIEIKKANLIEDKSGIDYWVTRAGMKPLSIDLKNREFCPIDKFGTDDACIETTSVYVGSATDKDWVDEKRLKPGWTLDEAKQTDYVVYTWPNREGLRFWILPFPFLCRAALLNWRVWAEFFGELPARNNGYVTLSIYPPRNVIVQAMKPLMSGIC